MPEPSSNAFPTLVTLLARLEDELPYVTTEDVLARWPDSGSAGACATLLQTAIGDGRLFTDYRQRFEPATRSYTPVQLVRLNRRHAAVEPLLD